MCYSVLMIIFYNNNNLIFIKFFPMLLGSTSRDITNDNDNDSAFLIVHSPLTSFIFAEK